MQESALARAGRRDDGNHLSLLQTEICIGQNLQAFLAASVDFLQAPRFHDDRSLDLRGRIAPANCLVRVVFRLGHFGLKPNSPMQRLAIPVSTSLDAIYAIAVFPVRSTFRARRPKSFLFLPNACLSPCDAAHDNSVAPLSLFFSIACSGLCLTGMARVTPHSARLLLPLYTSKPCAKCLRIKPLVSAHLQLSPYS